MNSRQYGRTILLAAFVLCAAAAIIYYLLPRQNGNNRIITPNSTGKPQTDGNPQAEKSKQKTSTETAYDTLLNRESGYESRMKALKTLYRYRRDLNGEETAAIRKILADNTEHPTIRNDILSLLEQQTNKPNWLGCELVRMWNDTTESAVWRDYCLQHMSAVAAFSESEKSILTDTLFAAASDSTEAGRRFKGTALISLSCLGKSDPVLQARLSELARAEVAQPEDAETRVTAFQVALENGDQSVLSEARKCAADEQALARLRMSAIGVIGGIGDASDIGRLEQLSGSGEKRVAKAAAFQAKALRKRLGL